MRNYANEIFDANARRKMINEKILTIQNFASEHPEFNTDFVDSLAIQFGDNGDLSDKQILCLTNIIEKWRMDE